MTYRRSVGRRASRRWARTSRGDLARCHTLRLGSHEAAGAERYVLPRSIGAGVGGYALCPGPSKPRQPRGNRRLIDSAADQTGGAHDLPNAICPRRVQGRPRVPRPRSAPRLRDRPQSARGDGLFDANSADHRRHRESVLPWAEGFPSGCRVAGGWGRSGMIV